MAGSYKRKTKNFFIKKDLQGKMILAVFLSVVVGCLLFILLLGIFSADTMTISYSNNDIQVGNTPWMLLKSAVAANWIFLVIGGTCLVLAAIVRTHRIAGPLFRFEKALTLMNEGDLTDTIYLRGKDEGKELADKINQFNLQLSDRLKSMNRHAKATSDLLAQFEALDIDKISQEDKKSMCDALKTINQKLQADLDYFAPRDD